MHMETDRRAYVTEVTVQKYSFLFARFHEWKMSQNIRCPQYVGISFRFLILWFIWKKKNSSYWIISYMFSKTRFLFLFSSFLLLCLSVCITFACGYTLVFLPPMSSTLSTHRWRVRSDTAFQHTDPHVKTKAIDSARTLTQTRDLQEAANTRSEPRVTPLDSGFDWEWRFRRVPITLSFWQQCCWELWD